jgi:hypothetical protein
MLLLIKSDLLKLIGESIVASLYNLPPMKVMLGNTGSSYTSW